MGVHILKGDYTPDSTITLAIMYCSTTDWAFGPVFSGNDNHDAEERCQAFLDWLGKVDPRSLSDSELEGKYTEWQKQEEAQWKAKDE